jgi:hypothetical protein
MEHEYQMRSEAFHPPNSAKEIEKEWKTRETLKNSMTQNLLQN